MVVKLDKVSIVRYQFIADEEVIDLDKKDLIRQFHIKAEEFEEGIKSYIYKRYYLADFDNVRCNTRVYIEDVEYQKSIVCCLYIDFYVDNKMLLTLRKYFANYGATLFK